MEEHARLTAAHLNRLVLLYLFSTTHPPRYVPSAVKDLIKDELKLTDAQTSYPLTGMILVYMVCSPFFGWLADHQIVGRRPLLTAAGGWVGRWVGGWVGGWVDESSSPTHSLG